jgi:hypothetical protein
VQSTSSRLRSFAARQFGLFEGHIANDCGRRSSPRPAACFLLLARNELHSTSSLASDLVVQSFANAPRTVRVLDCKKRLQKSTRRSSRVRDYRKQQSFSQRNVSFPSQHVEFLSCKCRLEYTGEMSFVSKSQATRTSISSRPTKQQKLTTPMNEPLSKE